MAADAADRARPGHPAAPAGLAYCGGADPGRQDDRDLPDRRGPDAHLILGTTLLFQLQWGDPLRGVPGAAAVFGAVGWGMLLTAVAKTPGQVSAIGSAMMLTFGILAALLST